ncbi:hypothetical protein EMCRGX_G016955 [Ephydatia muelleri]
MVSICCGLWTSCRWIQQYQNLQQWSVAHCELQNSSVMLSLYVGASVVQSPPVGSNLCDGQGHVVLFEQASNTFYVTVDMVHTAAITAAIVPLLTMKHVSYPLLNGTSVQVEVAASQFVRFETSLTDKYLYSVTSLNSAGSADSSWSLTQEGSLVAYNAGGSTQSNASSVTTIESSPDGVPFPNVTIINATALAIVWSTPLVPNGIVTGYVVLQTNIPSGFSYVSTDLQPFTAYSCSILACTNVGSTYIIVSWDLPTHSNGILINFSLYCNGALAGVLPLTVISYNTTGLLPFTFYMYMSSSHAHRHCTPVGTWCWASSVLQPACPDPPVHCDSNLLSMRRTALLGRPPDPESDTDDIVISVFINKIINPNKSFGSSDPMCILLLQLSSQWSILPQTFMTPTRDKSDSYTALKHVTTLLLPKGSKNG